MSNEATLHNRALKSSPLPLKRVPCFTAYAADRVARDPQWLAPLRGKSLICWCHPEPCYADTLLKLANAPRRPVHRAEGLRVQAAHAGDDDEIRPITPRPVPASYSIGA